MSIKKRLKVLWAALTQQWTEHACDECGDSWWEVGRDQLAPRTCAACEGEAFDRYMNALEARFQEQDKKGAA